SRALRGEEAPRDDQRGGADEDVAVDEEQSHQPVTIEDARNRRTMRADEAQRDRETHDHAGTFRDHGAERSSGDAEAELPHQYDGSRKVDGLDRHLQDRRGGGPREAREQAQKKEIANTNGADQMRT